MTITTATYPVAPATTPRKGTLLDAATVSDDYPWLDTEGIFDSYNCMKFRSAPAFCAPNSKTFDNTAGWQDGFRFGAYGGVVCKAPGLDVARMKSEVGRVFAAGESTAVERALMANRFVASAGNWAAPTDITPAAGAVKPAVGIAMLEGYASDNYVGAPTLHLPVVIASLILGVDGASFNGSVLETKMGSKIAAGAGYDYNNTGPTGANAATGEKWLYATGEVLVVRSDAEVQQVMAQSTNEVFVLAERAYVVAVDCFTAAIRVQVTA